MSRLLASALLLAALSASAFAEGTLTAEVDTDTITIGDRVRLTFRLSCRAGEDAALPVFPEGKIGPFEILETDPILEETVNGVRTLTSALTITIFETGEMEIPAMRAEGIEGGTAPIRVVVRSVGIDPSGEIRTVKNPKQVARGIWWTLLPVLGAVLLAAAILLLYRRIKRRDAFEVPAMREVDLQSAYENASGAIERLEKEDEENELGRVLFFRVSDIVRIYIRDRYSLPARERTSREILREIRGSGISPESVGALREFFRMCDLVKFRGGERPPGSAADALKRARLFVENTRGSGRPAAGEGAE